MKLENHSPGLPRHLIFLLVRADAIQRRLQHLFHACNLYLRNFAFCTNTITHPDWDYSTTSTWMAGENTYNERTNCSYGTLTISWTNASQNWWSEERIDIHSGSWYQQISLSFFLYKSSSLREHDGIFLHKNSSPIFIQRGRPLYHYSIHNKCSTSIWKWSIHSLCKSGFGRFENK